MGITYGDHLIDSGYREMTPEQERQGRPNAQEMPELDERWIVNPWEAEAERLRVRNGEIEGLLFGVRNQDAFLDMPKYLRDAINRVLNQP